MPDCIFCQIVQKRIPADIVFEDDRLIAFHDIHPLAPVHLLIIPKEHIESTVHLKEKDIDLLGHLLYRAKLLADQLKLATRGYKLIIRTGPEGGAEVNHLHLHLIGGKPVQKVG